LPAATCQGQREQTHDQNSNYGGGLDHSEPHLETKNSRKIAAAVVWARSSDNVKHKSQKLGSQPKPKDEDALT
jgi:hypothetical protein